MTGRLALLLVLAAALAACDDFATGAAAYREGRFGDARKAFAAAVQSSGDGASAELLYDEALSALRAGDLKDANSCAERAATRNAELRPLCDFLRGNIAFARCELGEKQAMSLEAEPFAFDVAMHDCDLARRSWEAAATSRQDWPEARRNVERALRKLAELRDRKSQADKAMQQAKSGEAQKSGMKPQDAPPVDAPPPPPSGQDQGQDPSETPDQPQLTELPRDQVLRLFEKLAEKERERLAARRAARQNRPPEVERDW